MAKGRRSSFGFGRGVNQGDEPALIQIVLHDVASPFCR